MAYIVITETDYLQATNYYENMSLLKFDIIWKGYPDDKKKTKMFAEILEILFKNSYTW